MLHRLRAPFFVLLTLLASPLRASNPVQIENEKPGTPQWVLQQPARNREIEGYASATSVNRGESVDIFVNTADATYSLEVFRMGWYNGAGARRILGPVTRTGVQQIIPSPDPVTGMVECNWTDPYRLTIPSTSDLTDWASGIYLVKLTGSSGKQTFVPFVVRDDARFSNHYFQASVTTWQAYNRWGGKSLYPDVNDKNPAVIVSFDRPYASDDGTGQFLWQWEYNMVRFLEREGYDVTYCTNLDTARRGALMRNHESFLSVGHDEYWSWEMRENVIAARDAGVDLGIFSANTAYWQIRHAPNAAGVADRRMIAYKEQAMQRDPFALDNTSTNNHLITTRWRDAPVNLPEAALLGVQYVYNSVDTDVVVDDVQSAPWVFEGTGLSTGSVIPKLLGYEVDATIDGVSPPNLIRLAQSPYTNTKVNPPRTEYSQMTLHTAPSGALVFAAGTIQWSWGLDEWNNGRFRVHAGAQQLTRNLLRRFAGARASIDCYALVSPRSITAGKDGGTGTLSVTAQAGCAWHATPGAPWITIIGGSTGEGSGTVTYSLEPNSSASRTGIITINGVEVTIRQDSGCSFSVAPASADHTSAAGSGSVAVTTSGPDCPWSAVTSSSGTWITFTSTSSGVGSGSLSYSIPANLGPRRTAAIRFQSPTLPTISFNVGQDDGCTYSVTPTSAKVPLDGGSVSVAITTSSDLCHWTTGSGHSWISVTPPSGKGKATAKMTIGAANAPRNGIGWAAAHEIAVTQKNDCTYTITPASMTLSRRASTQTLAVSAPAGCTDAPTSTASWITFGSGTTFQVAANDSGAPRTATINIGAQTATVTQNAGAASAHTDFDGDGQADLFWHHAGSSASAIWLMRSDAVKSSGYTNLLGSFGTPAGIGDFDGNGRADVLWRNGNEGKATIWLMNGLAATASDLQSLASQWVPEAVADFNGDGKADILWRNSSTSEAMVWLMNGATVTASEVIARPSPEWVLQGAGDFDGDGRADLLWRNSRTFHSVVWLMNGAAILTANYIATPSDIWSTKGVGDFNGDGKADILWRSTYGETVIWLMNGLSISSAGYIVSAPPGWQIGSVGDYDADGRADLVWRSPSSGLNAAWFMNGIAVARSAYLPTVNDPGFAIVGPR